MSCACVNHQYLCPRCLEAGEITRLGVFANHSYVRCSIHGEFYYPFCAEELRLKNVRDKTFKTLRKETKLAGWFIFISAVSKFGRLTGLVRAFTSG